MMHATAARAVVSLLAGLAMATAIAQAQTTIHVDDNAPGDPGPGDPAVSDPLEDGSADHPFDAIQEGINAAIDGDAVLVLDGVYTGYGNGNIAFNGKLITVRSENGAASCVIDCQQAGRGFHFQSGDIVGAVLEGFTVANAVGYDGGAVLCGSASLTIRDCVFVNGSAWGGGAVRIEAGSPTLIGCVFRGNSADYGGAVDICGGTATLIDCTFVDNSAEYGGAMMTYYFGRVTLTGCDFVGNRAHIDSTFTASGGAIENSNNETEFRNCTFSANVCDYGGGAIANFGCTSTLTNCLFVGNLAMDWSGTYAFGGGVYASGSNLTLANCTFAANAAPLGDGLSCHAFGVDSPNTVDVVNSIFWNSGKDDIYHDDDSALTVAYSDVRGGWPGDGNIDADPLFVGEFSGWWTGECVYDPDTGQTTLTDAAAGWAPGELAGGFLNPDLEAQPRYFLIVTNTPTTVTAWGDLSSLTYAGAEYRVRDCHLSPGAPGIDAGNNAALPPEITTDLDGNPRIVDDAGMADIGAPPDGEPFVDMGVYEFQGETCFGDLDADDDIDLADLAALLANYETAGTVYADGDLDRDGDVDLADLAALLAVYDTTCS